jgi:23S rRNA (uracil1939-C5)-methyltransferase
VATELVRIDRIAAGGDGVGRLADGRVAFVPRTAPGDLAECRIGRTAPRFVRARMVRLVEPGPDRVEPPCRHYLDDECGGCQLQHLDSSAQRSARRAIAGDAVRRIAKIPCQDPPLEPTDAEFGYRAKISLTRGSDGRIGYHRLDQPGRVFQLERCLIARSELMELWRRLSAARRLLPATLARVVLRLDRQNGEHLILETGEGPVWQGGAELRAAVRGDRALTVWLEPGGGAARVVAGADSAYPATAFEQVNPMMGDRVRARAVERLGAVAGRRVWDLYSGIGETSSILATAGATVESVERDLGAVAEAERRQSALGRRVERVSGPVEAVAGSLGRPDLVVANPPRSGMDRRVVDELVARRPERIVYVSCDPATLARDLGHLARGGYRLAGLEAFDLFPQTAHVESVAVVEPA